MRLYELSQLTDGQRKIMALLAQFPANAPIYYKIRDWAGFSQDDMNGLVELGWVDRGEQSYVIHAVVRESVREQLRMQGMKVDPLEYGNLVDELADVGEYLGITLGYEVVRGRMVVPETVVGLMMAAGREGLDFALLCNNLGFVCRAEGDLASARRHHEAALRIRERSLGPDHPAVATSRNNLGALCHDEGDLASARRHHEAALRILERALGPDHPNTRVVRSNLEVVLDELTDCDAGSLSHD